MCWHSSSYSLYPLLQPSHWRLTSFELIKVSKNSLLGSTWTPHVSRCLSLNGLKRGVSWSEVYFYTSFNELKEAAAEDCSLQIWQKSQLFRTPQVQTPGSGRPECRYLQASSALFQINYSSKNSWLISWQIWSVWISKQNHWINKWICEVDGEVRWLTGSVKQSKLINWSDWWKIIQQEAKNQ